MSHAGPLDNIRLLHVIVRLCRAGERDAMNGGVATERMAEAMPHAQTTIRDHCHELTEAGYLVKVIGVNPTGRLDARDTRPSYLPVGHPDAPDTDSDDSPPRTLAEQRRGGADD